MAYGMHDRVREQVSFGGGTGAITLSVSAVSGFVTFLAGWGASGTGEYCLVMGAQWETGFGTINAGGTTLARTTVYDGSSGAGVAVNFSAGTLDCTSVVPAELAHFLNMLEISVADSATPDIGAVRGSAVTIAGTTTITGFGSSKNRRRFIRFSTARIITHNVTSLILPGAANITTVAGDTAVFQSDSSGNWRCISYMRGARGTLGTATNNDAAAGDAGEYTSATLASGSATALVSATAKTITSISLTAGDWDVFGYINYVQAGTTVVTALLTSLSQTDNTRGTEEAVFSYGAGITGGSNPTGFTPLARFSLSATTTIYLIGFAVFTTSTCSAWGKIRARRIR